MSSSLSKEYIETVCEISNYVDLGDPDLANLVRQALKSCRDHEDLLVLLELAQQSAYQEAFYG